MDEEYTPFISIDCGEDAGRLSWESAEKLAKWIKKEHESWSWLSIPRENSLGNAWDKIYNTFQAVGQELRQVEAYKAQPEAVNRHKTQAQNAMQRLYKSYPFLLPGSSYRDFIFKLRDEGDVIEAGVITAHLMNIDLRSAPFAETVSAITSLRLFDLGVKQRAKTETRVLGKVAGEMRSLTTEQQERLIHHQESFDSAQAERTTAWNNFQQGCTDGFNEVQTERVTAWDQLVEKANNDLDHIKDTYDKHMSLAAPVDYWETKKQNHFNWAIGCFVAVVVCMIAFAVILYCNLPDMATLSATVVPEEKPPALSVWNVLVVWKIGFFVLLVTLALWFIRLLVRMFLSHLHLSNDAAERVTMVKTYLAFNRDGALSGSDHIGTILAALFRPSGDGMVKDEGMPSSAMEWITKLGGKS